MSLFLPTQANTPRQEGLKDMLHVKVGSVIAQVRLTSGSKRDIAAKTLAGRHKSPMNFVTTDPHILFE